MAEPRSDRVRPAYRGGMTLRVYVVSGEDGAITRDTGTKQIAPGNLSLDQEVLGSNYPECTCPHHVRERAGR